MGRKRVYISGPYRAATNWQIERNVRISEEAMVQVLTTCPGAAPFSPCVNTRHLQGVVTPEEFLAVDMAWLKVADVILMVGPWVHSEGATRERDYAIQHGIRVVYTVEQLAEWIEREANHAEGEE